MRHSPERLPPREGIFRGSLPSAPTHYRVRPDEREEHAGGGNKAGEKNNRDATNPSSLRISMTAAPLTRRTGSTQDRGASLRTGAEGRW